MQHLKALVGTAALALLAPLASAGVVQVYPPYGELVEANVTTTPIAADDGFFLRGDDTTTFDGALRWSFSFAIAPEVHFMTGDASFAVPAEGIPDGIDNASLLLYRGTVDGVAHGDLGDVVHRFDVGVAPGGSWAFVALDDALTPLGDHGLYSLVFAGDSVANPYFQARVDFRATPLEGSQPPAVPEPASALLFALGAVALVVRRRRGAAPPRACSPS